MQRGSRQARLRITVRGLIYRFASPWFESFLGGTWWAWHKRVQTCECFLKQQSLIRSTPLSYGDIDSAPELALLWPLWRMFCSRVCAKTFITLLSSVALCFLKFPTKDSPKKKSPMEGTSSARNGRSKTSFFLFCIGYTQNNRRGEAV